MQGCRKKRQIYQRKKSYLEIFQVYMDKYCTFKIADNKIYIKNQTLYVHLTSAPLRQELMMGREMLVRTLNRHVGAQVIANIIIR